MPASRLPGPPGTLVLHPGYFLGSYSMSNDDIVRHLGVFAVGLPGTPAPEPRRASYGESQPVHHVKITNTSKNDILAIIKYNGDGISAHVVGWEGEGDPSPYGIEKLRAVQAYLLRLEEGDKETGDPAHEFTYILHPPFQYQHSSTDRPMPRMNCVGLAVLVSDLLLEKQLFAVDVGDSNALRKFPQVGLDWLCRVFPWLKRLKPPEREKLGLTGPGPWGVVLPGYIFHALQAGGDFEPTRETQASFP